jgi:CBS domain-containing protein
MTLNPEFVSPETTVLEALQIMDDNKFLTLPVCEIDGRVGGLVDVMDCVVLQVVLRDGNLFLIPHWMRMTPGRFLLTT